MTLTREQRAAIQFEENLSLNACPGSGKTRVIVSKLARLIEEMRGTPRAVACITYTNAGVYEIEGRLLPFNGYADQVAGSYEGMDLRRFF